jgi:hypothetical protein
MTDAEISYYEKNFRIVYQPYKRNDLILLNRSRRFFVGSGQLGLYIGSKNAETVFRKANEMKTDKLRLKFREHGIVDVYVK